MSKTEYDLKSVNLPRLTGRTLRFVASLLESPLKGVLAGKLLKDAGIPVLRNRALTENPTYYPLLPFAGEPAPVDAPLPHLEVLLTEQTLPQRDFYFTSIREYAEAYRTGTLSPNDVAEKVIAAIAGIDQHSPPLRAFIASNAHDIRQQAQASAQRWQTGKPLSLLDGVPIAIKDEMNQVPYPTTVGTKFLGKQPATRDSTVVARLRAAGALLVGKTNMHEIGIVPTGINPHYGFARNPYNPAHYTGGSSSGSAVAVSAGICPVAIGADGGGSVRIPASLCGLIGLKATFGRISEQGAYPLDWTVAHIGPLAGSTEDALLVYAVIAGSDSADPISQRQPTPHFVDWDKTDLSDLTLGIYDAWFNHADKEVVQACQVLLEQFKKMGAKVKPITLPELDLVRVAHVVAIGSEMAQAMAEYDANHRTDFGLDVRVNLAITKLFTSRDYVQAQRVRTHLIDHLQKVFQEVDAIMTPTTAMASPRIPANAVPDGESDLNLLTELMRYAFVGNLSGVPAMTFPAGYTSTGMPIGCQAMGRWWDEHTLFRLAFASEQVVPKQKPMVHYPIL